MDRARYLSRHTHQGKSIVYWMSRDQRTEDNWALLFAQEHAIQQKLPLIVVFHLQKDFFYGQPWHLHFMIEGLKEVATSLAQHTIPFLLSQGHIESDFISLLRKLDPSVLVTDFDPLCAKRQWNAFIKENLPISFVEVDTHNIVPCWIASDHQEIAARTFRPKIHKKLHDFLTDIPPLIPHPFPPSSTVPTTTWPPAGQMPPLAPKPGEKAAWESFLHVLHEQLPRYTTQKNDPLANAVSRLSCYFHFGHLSPQRVAYEVAHYPTPPLDPSVFLEELIVRRELADNFVFYQPHYSTWEGLPSWAQKTLNKHRDDPRTFLYDLDSLENSQTHDPLWNACQKAMRSTGYLHGYLRMYWAKKILEWSPSPEDALQKAIYLNDQYFLDGRDPNGYTGILWSIGGLHDRPFAPRPIFGNIRFMSFAGCERKFSVEKYIQWAHTLP